MRRYLSLPLTLIAIFTLGLAATTQSAQAATKRASFNAQQSLNPWDTDGPVSVDRSKNQGNGQGGAMKVGPGGRAVWKLREANESGKVTIWVYDDKTAPKDPDKRRASAQWGLIQRGGDVQTVGPIYAPYLSGKNSYASTTYNPENAEEKAYNTVQYLGQKRREGWHKWEFDMDRQDGLSIKYDGQNVNAGHKRYDWNKSGFSGFQGVVILGDEKQGNAQTIWVDNVQVSLGGPMQAKVANAEDGQAKKAKERASKTPKTDPKPEKRIKLVKNLRGKHPRLLITKDEIPRLKQIASKTPMGKKFMKQLNDYVKVSNPPDHPKFQTNATDGQRQGLWRMPTAALHWQLTGDRDSFKKARGFLKMLLDLEHWETGSEQDSGMSSANVMIGAAIAYDWTYNDLSPAFREKFRKKLLLQARRQYYRGHMGRGGGGYWREDPANNHRWHRDAGMTLAAIAVARPDDPSDDWILAKTLKELKFIAKWLPDDGTSHEGPSYIVFGASHLTLALDAADQAFGTDFLSLPFYQNVASFRAHTLTPGLKRVFHFGDGGKKALGGYNNYLWAATGHNNEPDLQALVRAFYNKNDNGKPFWLGWLSLIWYNPEVSGGSIQNLPKAKAFPDMGLGIVRDGWKRDDVGFMLKASPYGGDRLNEYRNENDMSYINVAHDDPDANMFQIFARGAVVAQNDGYSQKKVTAEHNTIIVNGKGQKGEGSGWSQPIDDKDMSEMADLVAFRKFDNPDGEGQIVMMEGEAGNAYIEKLDRYRRTALWVPGKYILILDDIRADQPKEISWLVQSKGVEIVDENAARFKLTSGGTTVAFAMDGSKQLSPSAKVRKSPAKDKHENLGLQQLMVTANTAQWQTATVFDAWNHGNVRVNLKATGQGSATVTVKGPNFTDKWTWKPAPDRETASTVKLNRGQ